MKWQEILLVAVVGLCLGADTNSTKQSEAEQKRQLIELMSNNLVQFGVTNLTKEQFELGYNMFVVHPSFGMHWDDVPAPTLKGSNAMDAVNAFLAINGWNMHTGMPLLSVIQTKPITGLPWEAIKDRQFGAVTHQGVLYISLRGFATESDGIAYNPRTNKFPTMINGFKPIGDHWYVWKQTMVSPQKKDCYYEGETPNLPRETAPSREQRP